MQLPRMRLENVSTEGYLLQSIVSLPCLGFEGALGLSSPRELLMQLHALSLEAPTTMFLVAVGSCKVSRDRDSLQQLSIARKV